MMGLKRTSRLREEAGAMALIVALLTTTIFIGFLAYVADVGYLYEMRRQLQSAADAAALAGIMDINAGGTGIAAAQDYASQNDLIEPSEPLTMQAAEVTNAQGNPAFKVTVQKDAGLFFGGFFGRSSKRVVAMAQAKRVFVTGAKGVVPLAVNTLMVAEDGMEANLNNGPFSVLGQTGETYGRVFGADEIPSPATHQSYLVDMRITNDVGYVDENSYVDVGAVTVHQAGDTLTNATLDENTLAPGEQTFLRVFSTVQPTQATGTGRTYNQNDFQPDGANQWRLRITAPPVSKPLQAFPIQIKTGNGVQETYGNAAVLIVRTNNSPIASITMRNYHYIAGGTRPSIEVRMRELNQTDEYTLKYDSNDAGLPGNYSALRFGSIYHAPDYTWDHGLNGNGSGSYEQNLVYFPGVVHLLDKIYTEPGNMPSSTQDGLGARFLNCRCGCGSSPCAMTIDQWRETKPPGCKRLVKVPIVELLDKSGGSLPYIVVALGSFYITTGVDDLDDIKTQGVKGYFVEYVSAGDTTQDEEPAGQYILGARLERPNP